jgi:hypothetical protein
MHQHTDSAATDAEGREVALLPMLLPGEFERLRYSNVNVRHWSLIIVTYVCEGFSVELAANTAECVDCALALALAESLRPGLGVELRLGLVQ